VIVAHGGEEGHQNGKPPEENSGSNLQLPAKIFPLLAVVREDARKERDYIGQTLGDNLG
jgi:hypothetical protein